LGSGLEILTASSAEEGLETLKRARPRIVMLDLTMTQVRGAELLESILAIDPGTEVILMTDEYSAEAAVEAIQNGACDYLSKPSMRKPFAGGSPSCCRGLRKGAEPTASTTN